MMPNESTRPITFDTIRDRLFKLMRDKDEAGDEAAKQFLRGTVRDGKLVDASGTDQAMTRVA
jgi:hypothetical protein